MCFEYQRIKFQCLKFSHLLRVRAEVADPLPPPYGHPDRNISGFFCRLPLDSSLTLVEFYFCPPAVFVCWLHLFVGFPVIIVPLRLVEPLSTSPCCYLLMPWRTKSLKWLIWPILVLFCPPAAFVCWLHLFVCFLVVIDPLSTSPCSYILMHCRTKNLRHPLSHIAAIIH